MCLFRNRLARARLRRIEELVFKMAYDFSKLDQGQKDIIAAMEAMAAKVAELADQLAHPPMPVDDPAVQAHMDSVADALQAEVAKVSPPPAPAPAPAPEPTPAPASETPPAA